MHRPGIVWLLLAGLLAGQWLLATHDTQHWQAQSKAHPCQLCLHHPAQDLIAGAPSPLWSVAPTLVPTPRARPAAPQLLRYGFYRSRGPPRRLV